MSGGRVGWGTRRGVENSQGLAALVPEFFSTVGCSASRAGNDLRALDFFLCGLCWRGNSFTPLCRVLASDSRKQAWTAWARKRQGKE